MACLLAGALAAPAHAGLPITRTLDVAAAGPSWTARVEIPVDQVVVRATAVELVCAVDGARASQPVAVRPAYQGFERGRRVSWLELPDGSGLPAGHEGHALRLTVRIELEPSAARPVPRERVVAEWEESGGRARAAVTLRAGDGVAAGGASPGRRAQPFMPTQVPSLLGSPVEYLIVTSDALAASFQPLADWKTASGVPAAIRTLEFIRAQYPAAADDPERVRMFIRDAYSRWGTRWVLLGADTELLPPRYGHMTFLGDEHIPSDLYYSCLDGNWNADGDSTFADAYTGLDAPGDDADLLPEVWVGRAPVVTPSDVQLFVQKTLTYETAPVDDYMENLLFFAQVITPEHWSPGQSVTFDGAQIVEQDELPILDTAPNLHVARLYQNHLDPRWRPGSIHETKAVVYDSLEVGYNIVVHVGHGYREVMSCGDENLTNNDMRALLNGNRLMNFYAIDCTSNAIDFASIGEALMRAPAGGAVTNIGSTTLDYPAFGRVFQKEYFRLLIRDSVTAVGEAQGRQKLPFVGGSYFDGFARLSQLNLLLLGDPELRIYTARPRQLSVTAPATMTAGDSGITVAVAVNGSPLSGARVTAWMPGHEYRSALSDDAGNLALPFRPDTVGPCSLTVTAFNARPWRGTMQVVPGAPAALQALAATVLDDSLAGRSGDDDHVPEAGEHVDLVVPVRNGGGSGATTVTGTLSSSDPWVTITTAGADYGAIDPGATSTPATGFAITIAHGCPDQREVALTLTLAGDGGLTQTQQFEMLVRAPELVQLAHAESEEGGNDNGRPEPGETVRYSFRLHNTGTADAHALTGTLRSLDGLATVLDSTFTVAELPAGGEVSTSLVRFVPSDSSARLQLTVEDATGPRLTQSLDLGYPGAVGTLAASGGSGRVLLTWTHNPAPDLAGYNLYRATSGAGPFARLAPLPIGRISGWTDGTVNPLTQYFYQVTAIDSSGNESDVAGPVAATSGPREHSGFPQLTRESSQTPVTIAAPAGGLRDILTGGTVLHMFHPDGTALVDADGLAATPGDFSTLGSYYQGGGSIADLDGDGGRDVIGGAWNSKQLLTFDAVGTLRAGFPVPVASEMWSSIAVGDLDGDGKMEMVFASLGGKIYAFKRNGSEWMDGDGNPGTIGVFKSLGGTYNPGTPALVDLLGDGHLEIVYASIDGFLYAWKPDGTSMPGFPFNMTVAALGSVAVGKLDGPGGPISIVAPVASGALVVREADGSVHPGFPVFCPTVAAGRSPSPALADMNNDGFQDIVYASTNGRIYVFDRNGALVAPWSAASRFSTVTSEATVESPVVADINGDGVNDVVIGDETGAIAALSGATGTMLPGFPIQLAAEASGTAGLCDCDGDGLTEIVATDFGGTVHMWDYDFPFSPSGTPPWPQFQHDARRTGTSEPQVSLVAVEPPSPDLPRTLELAAPEPNPARGSVALAYGIPAGQGGAALEIAIYDLAGRRVRTITRGPAEPGRGVARWDMRDARGGRAPAGVFLARITVGGQTLTRKLVVLP